MEKNSLSVSMALASLADQCEIIERLEAEYKARLEEAYRARNWLIADARDEGVPVRRLQEITHLSRERIRQIRDGASRPPE